MVTIFELLFSMKEWFVAEAIRFSSANAQRVTTMHCCIQQVLLTSAYVKQTTAYAAAELAPN